MNIISNIWEFIANFPILLWDTIIPFLFILTVLIFAHEMGHYLIARRNKVRVEVFSIGFGKEIYGWTDRVGTRWKISALPLGGYVKMFGENDPVGGDDKKMLTPEEKAVSFPHKRLGQRTAIVAAGPIANILFAIILLAGLFNIAGIPEPYAGVGVVQPESAADKAGMTAGDRIVAIDGREITWFKELRDMIRARPGTRTEIVVLREGERIPLTAIPTPKKETGEDGQEMEVGLLGVAQDPAQFGYERRNPLSATWRAVEISYNMTTMVLSAVGEIVTGKRDTKELGGPIRIAQMSGQVAQGSIDNLIFFVAMLSINLGLINLFPIPLLDGGHLFFYLAEAIRGRPLGPRVQEYGFRFGLVLLVFLMIFVTWNDLVNF